MEQTAKGNLYSYNQNPKYQLGAMGALLIFIWLTTVLVLWGFAFVPSADFSPEWIARTQYICFGTAANGLPAAQGWILLILGPALLLSFMWATHAEEIYGFSFFLKNWSGTKLILPAFLILFMWEGHWVGKRLTNAYRITSSEKLALEVPTGFPKDYPRYDKPAPDFKLMNQFGREISLADLRGKTTILTFVFAHCATVCPVLIKDVLDAQNILNRPDVLSVFISLDPWRDTPSGLPDLAKKWKLPIDNSFMLSGSPENISQLQQKFNITSIRNQKSGEITHAAQVMILDKELKIAYTFLNPSVEWLVDAVKRALGVSKK